jgi:hypothetical protein
VPRRSAAATETAASLEQRLLKIVLGDGGAPVRSGLVELENATSCVHILRAYQAVQAVLNGKRRHELPKMRAIKEKMLAFLMADMAGAEFPGAEAAEAAGKRLEAKAKAVKEKEEAIALAAAQRRRALGKEPDAGAQTEIERLETAQLAALHGDTSYTISFEKRLPVKEEPRLPVSPAPALGPAHVAHARPDFAAIWRAECVELLSINRELADTLQYQSEILDSVTVRSEIERQCEIERAAYDRGRDAGIREGLRLARLGLAAAPDSDE